MINTFLGVAILCVLFLLYMVYEAHRNIILKQTLAFSNLPRPFDGYTIYFISDIHCRRISIKMLKHLKHLDIVIIGGDLTERGVPFSRVEENLRRLKQLDAPVIFVWGNHDLHVEQNVLVDLLNKFDIVQLVNANFPAHRENAVLNILGVDDATNHRDDLEKALREAQSGFRLLISHNPMIVNEIKLVDQISLVISGHTHGGQIRILGWGIREKGGVKSTPFGKLVISSGYGTTRFHLRLGAKPDTLLIQLKTEDH